MKQCAFCGGEYPEELTECPLDRQPLDYDTLRPVTPSRENSRVWAAFDVSSIAPQIQRVRQDHIAALRARPYHDSHRAGLIAMARRMITHLSFFRRERSEHELKTPWNGGIRLLFQLPRLLGRVAELGR